MQKERTQSGVGAAVAAALLMVGLTFALPPLAFGTAGRAARTVEPPAPAASAPSTTPAVLEPPVQAAVGTGEVDGATVVRVLWPDGTAGETDLGSYLWGVVAAEMPAGFALEALRAQAVAARSYTLWKGEHNGAHPEAQVCTDYGCCQAWLSREEALQRWGDKAEEYAARISQAVTGTDGMVLCYGGKPIQAAFHAASSGRTEDAVAVWGSTVPYLVGVDSPEDGESIPNYFSSAELTPEELRAALEPLGCQLTGEPDTWLEEITYTRNGNVAQVRAGGTTLRGNAVRTALGLRAPAFTAEYRDGAFHFSVTGSGHGVGMSQYGANRMAAEGKSWREIVGWYYTGVEVTTLPLTATPAEG